MSGPPVRSSATAARFTSFSSSTGTPKCLRTSSTRSLCQAGSAPEELSRPVTGSISPGAPKATVCSPVEAPAARTVRSSSAIPAATIFSGGRSGATGSSARPAVRPSRSAISTPMLSMRTSRPAT